MSKQIPQGIEVLVKRRSVRTGFKELLLRDRAAGNRDDRLFARPAEAAMLAAITADQVGSNHCSNRCAAGTSSCLSRQDRGHDACRTGRKRCLMYWPVTRCPPGSAGPDWGFSP